jgi:hypothetical protein
MKSMDGKQFAKDADMKPNSTNWLQKLGFDFLYAGIQA